MKHVFIQSTCTAAEIYQPIVLLINLIFIVCLEHQQCQTPWLIEGGEKQASGLNTVARCPYGSPRAIHSVNQNMTSQKRQTSICCLGYPGVWEQKAHSEPNTDYEASPVKAQHLNLSVVFVIGAFPIHFWALSQLYCSPSNLRRKHKYKCSDVRLVLAEDWAHKNDVA